MWFPVVLTVLAGYMLGNLNGAVSISNLLAKKDVREQGSGNAGLTNFLRMFGPSSALLVVCVDMLKAVVACQVGKLLLAPYGCQLDGVLIGGMAVCVGHIFPALLGFHGGKGVLSGVTVALMADWHLGLLALGIFAICLFITRYVSLSSILGTLSFVIAFPLLYGGQNPLASVLGAALGLLIVFMHRSNIGRLLKGTERKATFSKFRKKK